MLTFNRLLEDAGLRLKEVRLLRHQDWRYPGRPSPYILWRDQPEVFDAYQRTQSFANAAKLAAPYWASFVATPARETLFIGLYTASLIGPLSPARVHPALVDIEIPGTCNEYNLQPVPALSDYIGRLTVEWGDGQRAWIQRADSKVKPIAELRRAFEEDSFPGFSQLILNLADVSALPASWADTLRSTRGVYLLTCPRTREQYVGAAMGSEGFLGRWRNYAATGTGGNVALKSRDPSNYQISILETVGMAATDADIQILESLWKRKLQSREMGLNRN